jgi:hypothetical protein
MYVPVPRERLGLLVRYARSQAIESGSQRHRNLSGPALFYGFRRKYFQEVRTSYGFFKDSALFFGTT